MANLADAQSGRPRDLAVAESQCQDEEQKSSSLSKTLGKVMSQLNDGLYRIKNRTKAELVLSVVVCEQLCKIDSNLQIDSMQATFRRRVREQRAQRRQVSSSFGGCRAR